MDKKTDIVDALISDLVTLKSSAEILKTEIAFAYKSLNEANKSINSAESAIAEIGILVDKIRRDKEAIKA